MKISMIKDERGLNTTFISQFFRCTIEIDLLEAGIKKDVEKILFALDDIYEKGGEILVLDFLYQDFIPSLKFQPKDGPLKDLAEYVNKNNTRPDVIDEDKGVSTQN